MRLETQRDTEVYDAGFAEGKEYWDAKLMDHIADLLVRKVQELKSVGDDRWNGYADALAYLLEVESK
jgi:hypothetical protein